MDARTWLTRTARAIAAYLRDTPRGAGLVLRQPGRIRAVTSETGGWLADFGHLRSKGGGTLRLFFDRFPDRKTRRFSFCYHAPRAARAKEFSKAHTRSFGGVVRFASGDVEIEPIVRLRRPLAKR